MIKSTLGYFLMILCGSLLAALVGGLFAALIASVSPQFLTGLFSLEPEDGSVVRYAFSVGMIWGLFLGVGVSCFACFLTALVKIIRLRIEHKKIVTT
jgi:hypothetical protein